MNELEELVNDEPEVTSSVEAHAELDEANQEPEQPGEQQPEVTAEQEDTPAVSDKSESEHIPYAALKDERRKRQEYERELNYLKQQIAKEQQHRPDVFEDQEGAFNHLASSFEQRLNAQMVGLSRDMMMSSHDDYAELESEFVAMAQQNPALTQEMLSHPNPARFAYETARKARDYQAMQNVDEYKARIEAELREQIKAELMDEMKAKDEKTQKTDQVVNMPNLAKSRSSSSGFATPTDEGLSDILGR